MTAAKSFASVKLPESLVQQARDAAQPLRRSAAGQIEYWVTLGRVVEHSGLTVQEARDAIENYEAAAREERASYLKAPVDDPQASELIARFMAIETDGSLAQRVREVVAENRSKARRAAA
jgi:ParD-like antitoxin of type II bacterial toxin-antitoxin system